jgi:hypothetical protein
MAAELANISLSKVHQTDILNCRVKSGRTYARYPGTTVQHEQKTIWLLATGRPLVKS